MEPSDDTPFADPLPPPPPRRVSLPAFPPSSSPSLRRLSSQFVQPSKPLRSARQLAWVSLQGRLVGADEASSSQSIGGGLGPQEAVAWHLFSPMQRVLVVAVIAVAAANSEKSKRIYRLTKSVELRDQVLQSMQQKLDSLCEQLNNIKDQPATWADMSIDKSVNFVFKEPIIALPKLESFGCGCQFCDHHKIQLNGSLVRERQEKLHPISSCQLCNDNSLFKSQSGDDVSKYKYSLPNAAEAEERRMSDLSDWNSSIASSFDIQMNSVAIEQDIDNLKKECEEKDATIMEMSAFLQSSGISCSKRIAELEDIIRTKNMRITRLKKDMLVLEQKVVHLTRLRRASNSNTKQIPAMTDNVLYDMESTTSSSSSDSDVSKTKKNFVSKNSFSKVGREAKGLNLIAKKQQPKARPVSPLKEKSLNQKSDLSSKKRFQSGKKLEAFNKRWV